MHVYIYVCTRHININMERGEDIFFMDTGFCNYGDREVPQDAIWKLEDQGSWRCNEFSVRLKV
jgi:hypothetical protein